MYPVVVVASEGAKMEVVHTYHTAYAGFKGGPQAVVIELQTVSPLNDDIRDNRALEDKAVSDQATNGQVENDDEISPIGHSETSSSAGQAQVDLYFDIVRRIEDDMTKLKTYSERRDLLANLRRDMESWSLSEKDFQFIYAIFLERNPSEMPNDHVYGRHRGLTEKTAIRGGTSKKCGRNMRQPGEICFSVQLRQEMFFNRWTWPLESETTVDNLVDVGPRDEELIVTPQPPQGETWSSLAALQQETVQQPWSEEWRSVWPHYGSPIPEVKDWILRMKEALRPSTIKRDIRAARDTVVKAKNVVADANRSVDWTLNVTALLRHHWPRKCGRIFVRRSMKEACKNVGVYEPWKKAVSNPLKAGKAKLTPTDYRLSLVLGQVHAM